MASSVPFHTPDFNGGGDRDSSADTKTFNHANKVDGEHRHPDHSRATRSESAATAVTANPQTSEITSGMKPMEKIETAHRDNSHGSTDPTLNFAETVKQATRSARKKMYLHHRHNRHLTKQFSPGSVLKHLHLPFVGSSHTDEEKADHESENELEHSDSQTSTFWQNIMVMFTTFPYWNMAFWSGWCYSIGSAMFIADAAWSWIPLQWPGHEFEGQEKYGVPLMFFFGACLYQIGGVMAYLEAVNDGSFHGAALKKLLEGHQDIEKELLDAKLHTFFGHIVPHHHHEDEEEELRQKKSADSTNNWDSITKKQSPEDVYAEAKDQVQRRGGVDHGPQEPKEGQVREYLTWQWWPTWHGLITYHIFELGYIACAIQLFGVTLYGVTSVVILPGIFDHLAWWQKLGAYWVPQVVASCCFLIASIMFTIMAQDRWFKPKWGAVSWWIGIHAQIGSVGFL